MIRTLLADLRFGTRLLRQAPVFGSIAVLALALGIGANTAIFSTVNALLLRDLPYRDPDRLVMIWEDASFASFPKNTPAPGNYTEWKRQNTVFTDIAATRGSRANLTADGPPEQVLGRDVTANFFDVLGTPPVIGRAFTEEEDRTNPYLVVLSYGLWQRRYAGDPDVVNRTTLMNGVQYKILGVMGRDFVFRDREIDYWTPAHFSPAELADHGSHYLNVVARLKPGVSVERARQELSVIGKRLEAQFPNGPVGVVVVPLREDLLGKTRLAVLVLMGAAGCVLLIACANLANLLLARSLARRREMAVRAALGAGRWRLVRQVMTEGMLLSVTGGAIGLVFAAAGSTVLGKLVPVGFHAAERAHIDGGVLGFTLALSLLTGVLFSVLPALQASRISLNDSLRQGGRGEIGGRRTAMRDVLVVAEVATALVLLVGAGLMLQTLARLRAVEIGFRSDHLLTMGTMLPRNQYKEPAQRLAFFERVVEGVRALPGVEGAAYNSLLPFQSSGNSQSFRVEGRPEPRPGEASDALLRVGDPRYLKTLGVRLLEGRLPDARDVGGAPLVIVINETLAKRWFPHESALGHRIAMSWPRPPVWRTIIGVVTDVHERGYELEMKPGVYIPYPQFLDTWAQPSSLMARTKGDPAALAGAVRRVIASVDPTQPVSAVMTMDEILDRDVRDRTEQMTLLGAFAGLALLLASIGLYGVLSYAVTQRSREIGLRMALGASARGVMRMVVGRGLLLTGCGLAIGLVAALAATRLMKTLLYQVDAVDPATFAAVSALLGTIAVLACWIPARRAARVDPIVVLREE
jgi:putative ABC transport system permease protein